MVLSLYSFGLYGILGMSGIDGDASRREGGGRKIFKSGNQLFRNRQFGCGLSAYAAKKQKVIFHLA